MEKSMEHDHQRRECSFKPQISKHSRQLMEKRTHNKDYQKVEDRLIGYLQKAKERQADMEESAATHQSFINQSHRRSQSLLGLKNKGTSNKSPSFVNKQGKGDAVLDTSHLLNNTTLVERSTNIFASGYDHTTFRALENQPSSHKGAQFSFKKALKSRRSGESKKQAWLPENRDPEDSSRNSSEHKTPRLNQLKSSKRALGLSPDSDEPICKSGSKVSNSRPTRLPTSSQTFKASQASKENQMIVPIMKDPAPKKLMVETWQKDDLPQRSKSNLKHLSSQSTHQDADSSQHQTSTQQEDSVSESFVKATAPEAAKKLASGSSKPAGKPVHMQSVLSSDRESKPSQTPGRLQQPASKSRPQKPVQLLPSGSNKNKQLTGKGLQESVGLGAAEASTDLKRTPSVSATRSTRGNDNKESDLSRSRKLLVNEKYTVKVKTQVIDCKEIQETIVGGETTSMLENLKRLNTNLKKFNQLECIIKDVKGVTNSGPGANFAHLRAQESTNPGSGDGNPQNRLLKQLEQSLQPSAPSRPGANPFIELFAGNALTPIN